ncbi:putative nucleotidyltransferase [Granulicella aggregans]|uniref:Putative nucleotidyltransferase n=1 Tax=Granulicella aggregans TaxID=474949 RepID=A0A7W7ZFG3_9BACT|nr:nucleotidyltransferase domain-containing protein [Granulicella aggregans]MBB5058995.1 putative nucleotidyltransferase [Granulicella aggregans]
MLTSPHLAQIERSGFGPVDSVIHLFVGGSELHGAKVGATDDLDLYGVFIGEPEDVLGLNPQEHFVWSTASDDRRNGPDDVDLTLYSLSKWAAMAAKGNATALHFLFAAATAASAPVWSLIQDQKQLFLSKRSAVQFLGFAENQLKRISGEKGKGAKGTRPEYEGAFGYDTKAAMHTLRLLFECRELMQEGTITLPRPEREVLIDLRGGSWTLERFLAESERAKLDAETAAASSFLPDWIDEQEISALVARVHLSFWNQS